MMLRLPDPLSPQAIERTASVMRNARLCEAWETIAQFDPDPVFAKLAQRRFLDLTNKEFNS